MAQGPDAKTIDGEARRGLRWGVERRLEFVDFRLCWDGRINRSDLTEQFGISTPQASADLARYQELAPTNVYYDPSLKCYLAAGTYRPVFEVEDSDRYLGQLNSLASGTIAHEEAWLAETPEFRVVPNPGRSVDSHRPKGYFARNSGSARAPDSVSIDVETGAAMALDHATRARLRRV